VPIIYNHQPDDFVAAPAPFRGEEDGSAWWAGAQRCFASVALATLVTATSLSAAVAQRIHQQTEDVPPPLVLFCVLDDYWQNPVRAVAASLSQQLPFLPDPDEIPAGSLFGVPDDCSGTLTVPYSIAPVVAALQCPQQFVFDQQEAATASAPFAANEDYWLPVCLRCHLRWRHLPSPRLCRSLATQVR
jgi:hypothetical protein